MFLSHRENRPLDRRVRYDYLEWVLFFIFEIGTMWVEVRLRGQWWRRKLRCVGDSMLVFHAVQNPVGSRYKRTFTVGPRTEATRHFYAPHKGFVVVISTNSRSAGAQNDELLVRFATSVAGGQFMRCVTDMAAALCKEDLACIRRGLTALSRRIAATMHAPKHDCEVFLPSLPVPRIDIMLMAVSGAACILTIPYYRHHYCYTMHADCNSRPTHTPLLLP
jgi:hypothetical protein